MIKLMNKLGYSSNKSVYDAIHKGELKPKGIDINTVPLIIPIMDVITDEYIINYDNIYLGNSVSDYIIDQVTEFLLNCKLRKTPNTSSDYDILLNDKCIYTICHLDNLNKGLKFIVNNELAIYSVACFNNFYIKFELGFSTNIVLRNELIDVFKYGNYYQYNYFGIAKELEESSLVYYTFKSRCIDLALYTYSVLNTNYIINVVICDFLDLDYTLLIPPLRIDNTDVVRLNLNIPDMSVIKLIKSNLIDKDLTCVRFKYKNVEITSIVDKIPRKLTYLKFLINI